MVSLFFRDVCCVGFFVVCVSCIWGGSDVVGFVVSVSSYVRAIFVVVLLLLVFGVVFVGALNFGWRSRLVVCCCRFVFCFLSCHLAFCAPC